VPAPELKDLLAEAYACDAILSRAESVEGAENLCHLGKCLAQRRRRSVPGRRAVPCPAVG
jgi:hypothetical protein